MPLRFTFRQLEYLVAVGDAGTIALAAQRLNVSSPSISAAISQLEAEFGIQIFVRHHAQGLSLTPGGRRIFNESKRILVSAAGLSDMASEIIERPRGPISVGVLATLAPLLSASLRRSFEAVCPEADVSLHTGHQLDLLQMLGRAEVDVAVTYDLDIPKDIAFEALGELPPWVMLPEGHALTAKDSVALADLAVEPMVLLDLPMSRDYFLSLFQMADLRPNVAERTPDMSVARSLVANGFGFGLINARLRNDLAPDGTKLVFRPLSDDVRPMVLGLATKRADHRSGVVAAFFDHMRARLADGSLPGAGEGGKGSD